VGKKNAKEPFIGEEQQPRTDASKLAPKETEIYFYNTKKKDKIAMSRKQPRKKLIRRKRGKLRRRQVAQTGGGGAMVKQKGQSNAIHFLGVHKKGGSLNWKKVGKRVGVVGPKGITEGYLPLHEPSTNGRNKKRISRGGKGEEPSDKAEKGW